MKKLFFIVLIFLSASCEKNAAREIAEKIQPQGQSLVTYEDADGRVHYVSSLDKVPKEYLQSANLDPSLPKITRLKDKSSDNSQKQLALLSASGKSSNIIRYKDSNNRVHYVDSIRSVPEEYRDQVDKDYKLPEINKIQFKTPKPSGKSSKEVTIFVTDWCSYCRRLERFLNEEGIPYKSYDVEKSEVGRKLYTKAGGQGVPLVTIGDKVIRGFNKSAIRDALS